MGKTIRSTINHSTRNHKLRRHRTQNRRRTDVVDDEFKRAKRYQRKNYSWNPRPHGRAFYPKGITGTYVDSARKRREQQRLRKDYLNTLKDTLKEDTTEYDFQKEKAMEEEWNAYFAEQIAIILRTRGHNARAEATQDHVRYFAQ